MKKVYIMMLALFSVFLVSCNGSKDVKIEFWHNYSAADGQVEVLNKLIKKFETENEGIKVEAVFQEWSALRDGVVLGAQSGVLPDVLRGDIAFVPQFQTLGVLEALSDYEDYAEVSKTVLEQPNSSNLMNGKYYGIAANTNTKILFYNKDILEEANVKVPETLDELWDAVKAVSKDGVTGLVEPWTGIWNIGPFIWSQGGDILSPDNKTASGYLNSQIVIDVINNFKELYSKGQFTGSSLDPSALGDTDGWSAGKYAFQLDGPWREASNLDADINFGAVPLPEGENGSISVLGGENFMNFKTSSEEKKAAAWKFTKFMVGEQAQIEMAKHGQMPVNKVALTNEDVLEAMPLLPVFTEALQTAKARPVISVWSKVEDIIATKFAEAITGSKPVEKALNEAVEEVNRILK